MGGVEQDMARVVTPTEDGLWSERELPVKRPLHEPDISLRLGETRARRTTCVHNICLVICVQTVERRFYLYIYIIYIILCVCTVLLHKSRAPSCVLRRPTVYELSENYVCYIYLYYIFLYYYRSPCAKPSPSH